ncbi:MAG: hypothetical protein ACRCZP_15820, partial [Phycicoccus sp.]
LRSSAPTTAVTTGLPLSAVSVRAVAPGRWVTTAPVERSVRAADPVGGTSRPLVTDLPFPVAAVELGPDLLVADAERGAIVRVDGTDPARRVELPARLDTPAGLATDGRDVWATDLRRGRILQVVDDGVPLSRAKVVARGLRRPQAVAVGRPGELLVVETGTGRVAAVELTHGHTTRLPVELMPGDPAPEGLPTDGLLAGLAASPDGTVYVADPVANRVLRVDRNRS